jgi:APA family basic amino acid/polyamine antiporter
VGFVVYFFYGRTHSRLAQRAKTPAGDVRHPPAGNTR